MSMCVNGLTNQCQVGTWLILLNLSISLSRGRRKNDTGDSSTTAKCIQPFWLKTSQLSQRLDLRCSDDDVPFSAYYGTIIIMIPF